jgi:hypothetical protein
MLCERARDSLDAFPRDLQGYALRVASFRGVIQGRGQGGPDAVMPRVPQ